MKVLDLNLLLYAVNRDAVQHASAKAWLEEALSGDEPIAVPWIVILGFLRVATNQRVFSRALSTEEAVEIVDSWLSQPAVIAVSPRDDHWQVVRALIHSAGTAGNLTTDAHLAALAIESGAELCSTDADFGRFAGLRWRNPLIV